MSSLIAHHYEILSHFSQFEYHTQPSKNKGRRMSALTKIRGITRFIYKQRFFSTQP